MLRIKICGITNIEDALTAVEAGADALGFVFAESPRKIDVDTARDIIEHLPESVASVGVFANQDVDEIIAVIKHTGLQLAQLHGEIDHKFCALSKEIGCERVVRALRIRSIDDISRAAQDLSKCGCGAILLDAHVEGMMGGTGKTFDWDLAIEARSIGKPIILAGGLTPDNVEEAVRKVHPYAVDVSTGVEASPGKKDHEKIKEFIRNARKFA